MAAAGHGHGHQRLGSPYARAACAHHHKGARDRLVHVGNALPGRGAHGLHQHERQAATVAEGGHDEHERLVLLLEAEEPGGDQRQAVAEHNVKQRANPQWRVADQIVRAVVAGDGEVQSREEEVEVEVGQARPCRLVEQPTLRGCRPNAYDEEHAAHRSSGDEERRDVEHHWVLSVALRWRSEGGSLHNVPALSRSRSK